MKFFHKVKEAELLKPGINIFYLDRFFGRPGFLTVYFVIKNKAIFSFYLSKSKKWILNEIKFILFKEWICGYPVGVERGINHKERFKRLLYSF